MNTTNYTIYWPEAPLSKSRWVYHDTSAGILRELYVRGQAGRPTPLDRSEVMPDALSWARLLQGGAPQFESREASEIYNVLCNAAHWAETGNHDLLLVCLRGVVEDAEEWIAQIKAREAKAA